MEEKDYRYYCKYPRCIEAVEYKGYNVKEVYQFLAYKDPTQGEWGISLTGTEVLVLTYLDREKAVLALGDWLVFEELPLGQNQEFIVLCPEEMKQFSKGNPPQGAFIDHN